MIADGRFSLVSQGSLVISSLEAGDAGIYSCAAANDASHRPVIIQIRLTVLGMPLIVESMTLTAQSMTLVV